MGSLFSSQSSSLYLGFDVSTQSCKALVVDASLKIVYSSRVQFDADLPEYKTTDGCMRGKDGRVTSPSKMFVHAMELALDRLKDQGCPFDQIVGITGSAQQHGSVFLNAKGVDALAGLDAEKGTATEQLAGGFAKEESPIWMDTSCTESCKQLTEKLGGPLKVSALTGSTAQERFSGHLIRQFVQENGLEGCAAVLLISSFGASLLTGKVEAIDISDAAGMNLMDIRTKKWNPEILEFVAPGKSQKLREVLPEPRSSWEEAGVIQGFWAQKYGFSPSAKVFHWSGDNCCAVVGNGLVREGDIAVSLGTSDTALCVIPKVPEDPLPFGHLFPHPTLENGYWSMLCYTNGDVTRKKVRSAFFPEDKDGWENFSKSITATSPGNDGNIGIFFSTAEITPAISEGADFRAQHGEDGLKEVKDFESKTRNARAVIEMRALAMRTHLEKLMPGLFDATGEQGRLLVTGGASANQAILQVFADVFQRPVCCSDNTEGAALGAAMRAVHACGADMETLVAQLNSAASIKATPNTDTAETYRKAAKAYSELESKALKARGRM
mmetsp:Transcript_28675/g.61058  ORF Transcript_28675/g.61058 Transcript_28675/m.61058 type:complete len:553 (+) Transcript_28675:32-1690(+)